jgi:hypothetical protein
MIEAEARSFESPDLVAYQPPFEDPSFHDESEEEAATVVMTLALPSQAAFLEIVQRAAKSTPPEEETVALLGPPISATGATHPFEDDDVLLRAVESLFGREPPRRADDSLSNHAVADPFALRLEEPMALTPLPDDDEDEPIGEALDAPWPRFDARGLMPGRDETFADLDGGDVGPLFDERAARGEGPSPEASILPRCALFAQLPKEALIELSHAMIVHRRRARDVVFREGDPGDSCIVVAQGELRAHRVELDGSHVELATLRPGDVAGLFALRAGKPRQATLLAETDVEILEIDRQAVVELAELHPSLRDALEQHFHRRVVEHALASWPTLRTLPSDARMLLAASASTEALVSDEELFIEGAATGLWVVLEGALGVHAENGNDTAVLFAGEALLERTATATTAGELKVHALEATVVARIAESTLDASLREAGLTLDGVPRLRRVGVLAEPEGLRSSTTAAE